MALNRTTSSPSLLALQLGFWAAVTAFLTFVVFIVCFAAVAASGPLFTWTDLAGYLTYYRSYGSLFQNLAQGAMLVFGLSLVVLLNAVHECTAPARRVLTRTALGFGLLFAASTGIFYFAQVSAVRLDLVAGRTEGLEQFLQANPHSVLSAVNLLGWTVFFPLASLFVAPVFSGGGLERVARVAFLVNGLCCLTAGVAYVCDVAWLLFIAIDLGMGGAVMVASAALALRFRGAAKQPEEAGAASG